MKNRNLLIILLFLFFYSTIVFAQKTVDYEYDSINRLILTTYSNGTTVEYQYDELSNRISKIVTAQTQSIQISSISNQEASPNTPVSNIGFTVYSTETSADSLALTGSSSNKTLVPDANIVFGGSGENRTLTVTPATDQHGTTTITVTVSDGSASAVETFVMTVLSPENNPPTALEDDYGVNQGKTLSISAPGVLGNDTDPENDAMTAELVSYDGSGALTLNANGSFTYTHDGSASTTDSFTYKAHDGRLYSSVATVNITVNGATTGSISLDPISHDFGAVMIGQSEEQIFTLTNAGVTNLTVSDIIMEGDGASEFSLESDTCSGSTISTNDSCTFQVAFHPTQQDQQIVTVNIDSSDSQTPEYLLSISGTGVEETSPPQEGAAALFLMVHKDLLMEGEYTTVSIWFDQASDSDITVTLGSVPAETSDIDYPSPVVIPAGEQKIDFLVRSDDNFESQSDRTVILIAEGEDGQTAQQEIKILDDDIHQNNNGVLKFVAGGLEDDTDGDGVFEAGEDAEYEVWFQRTGTDSPQTFIRFSLLNDAANDLSLLDQECFISAMPTDFEPSLLMSSCSVSLRSDDDIADGDYYILMQWDAGGSSGSTVEDIYVKNETLPDFSVYGKALNVSLTPEEKFNWTLTPSQEAETTSDSLPELIIYRQKENETAEIVYRTYADTLEYGEDAAFDYEIVAPAEAGRYFLWAEINPDSDDRIAESDFDNNISNTFTLTVTLDEAPTGYVEVQDLTGSVWPLGETRTIAWSVDDPSGITSIPWIRINYNDSYDTVVSNVDISEISLDHRLSSNASYIADSAYVEIKICSGIKCSQFQSNVFEIADQSQDPSPPWGAPLAFDINNQPADLDRFIWAAFENSDGSQEFIYKEAEKYPLHGTRLVYSKLHNGTWQDTITISPDYDYYNSDIDDFHALQDQNGDIHLIYVYSMDDDRNANEVHYRHLSEGSLVASKQISNNSYQTRDAIMALGDTGNVFITWREYDRNTSTNVGTYYREGDGLNNWSEETLLRAGQAYVKGIAVNNGEPYIFFKDSDDNGKFKIVYQNGDVWAEPVAIFDYENISSVKLFNKKNASDQYELFYVKDNSIHCRTFELDQTSGQSEILNTIDFTHPEQYMDRYDVIQNDQGGYHIFYIADSSGGNRKVYHFYFDGTGEYFHQRISSLVMYVGYELAGVEINNSLTAYFTYDDDRTYRNQADYAGLISDLDNRPVIGLSEADLDFGDACVGCSVNAALTISNLGSSDLTVYDFGFSGDHADQFAVAAENCTGTAIEPQQSCTADLTFSPAGEGLENATLEIGSDDPASPVKTVALSGSGAANTAPRGLADSYGAQEDVALSVPAPGVLDNDEDDENDELSARLGTDVSHGSLVLESNGEFMYTPSSNYNGADSFTYFAFDGSSDSNETTVTINVSAVNDAPVGHNDIHSVNEGAEVTVDAPGILANDSDVENESLSAVLVFGTSRGTLTLDANGSFSYLHDGSETTTDSFAYKAFDGDKYSGPTTVNISINPVNDPPLASDDSFVTDEDAQLTISAPGVLSNDSDAENDSLAASLQSGASHGTVVLNSDGSFTYSPENNYNGQDSFTYRIYDGTAYSNTATATITVTSVIDPPTARNDSYSVNQGEILSIAAPGILENDEDVENDPLTASIVQNPTHGTLTLNADGSFTYEHDGIDTTTDTFAYRAHDGAEYSLVATVTIAIQEVQNAPEIDVQGNGISIADGDDTPSISDHTDFGNVIVGGSAERIFTISNTGNGDLELTGTPYVSVTGEGFSIQTQPASTIAPENSTTFVVSFNPMSSGDATGTISITSNDPDENAFSFFIQCNGFLRKPSIAGGGDHTVALKEDGTVWAWGGNSSGQLGDGTTTNRMTPVRVSNLANAVAIACGNSFSAALKEDGTVWGWGFNRDGQLGDGTNTTRHTPVMVSTLTGIKAISIGTYHTVALKEDGTVWAWGYNPYGQLGDGTNDNSAIPLLVDGLTNIIEIAAGASHTVALKEDGTVWAWGKNNCGQLGNGTNINSTTPVMVEGLANAIEIAAGLYHTAALKQDGTLRTWGYNTYGQLGDGTNDNSSTPVLVTGLTSAVKILARRNHTIALKEDGTVWGWGFNGDGQLGDGTTTNRTLPVQTQGVNDVSDISGGEFHTVAIKNDGSVWAWGCNARGQLGDTNSFRTIPVRVTGLTNATDIAGGVYHSSALKEDGTVWAWGYNLDFAFRRPCFDNLKTREIV